MDLSRGQRIPYTTRLTEEVKEGVSHGAHLFRDLSTQKWELTWLNYFADIKKNREVYQHGDSAWFKTVNHCESSQKGAKLGRLTQKIWPTRDGDWSSTELGLKSSYCLSQSCSQSPYHAWIWARFIWTNDQTIEIEGFNPASTSRRLHLKLETRHWYYWYWFYRSRWLLFSNRNESNLDGARMPNIWLFKIV